MADGKALAARRNILGLECRWQSVAQISASMGSVQVRLAYGTEGLLVDLPDGQTTVVTPVFQPGLSDPASALAQALKHPVAGPPLCQLARPGQNVAISVCDITRAQPRQLMVPAVLDELDGIVSPENVVILVATGTHRNNTEDELIQMLGEDVVSRYRVVNHDARDDSTLVDLGLLGGGVPAILNRQWVEAELRITTGFVEPHFFAGFSGGPKMVAPGLAGMNCVLELHNAGRIGHPLATWGVIEGNPVQEGLRAVVRAAPAHFGLDVVLNNRQEITHVFGGELFAMHRQACVAAKQVAMRQVDGPFDVVVTTNSGYPLDQNLYQSVKGMSAAAGIVRQGGLIICASECRDGYPDHGSYADILRSRSSAGELLDMIEAPGYSAPDQWQVQIQARIQRHAKVMLKSSYLSDKQLEAAHLQPVSDIGVAVSDELDKLSAPGRVCVLPEGPQTIPFLSAQDEEM